MICRNMESITRRGKSGVGEALSYCALLLVSLAVVTGCGDSGEPKFDKATNHFIEAQAALESGDREKAMTHLDASIAGKPSVWAYRKRAELHLEMGNDQQALQDAKDGLALDPEDRDMKWLVGELAKPAAQRFKGRFANPPSASK